MQALQKRTLDQDFRGLQIIVYIYNYWYEQSTNYQESASVATHIKPQPPKHPQ